VEYPGATTSQKPRKDTFLMQKREQHQKPGKPVPFRMESYTRYSQWSGCYTVSRVVYADCPDCGGMLRARDYCERCIELSYNWARERHLLRGLLRFDPYKYALRVDNTKSLKKSCGRHFYHEINYSRDFEAHNVSILLCWISPETGRYEVFPGYTGVGGYAQPRWFNNMAEATE
jgi:hypothetical protein